MTNFLTTFSKRERMPQDGGGGGGGGEISAKMVKNVY
jgi:hypothetical protein